MLYWLNICFLLCALLVAVGLFLIHLGVKRGVNLAEAKSPGWVGYRLAQLGALGSIVTSLTLTEYLR